MLTLHVRSRVFPQLEDAAQFIKAIIGMYDVFMENKRIKAAQAVANLVEVDSTAAAAAVAAEAAALQADVQVSLCCLLFTAELHIGTETALVKPCLNTLGICSKHIVNFLTRPEMPKCHLMLYLPWHSSSLISAQLTMLCNYLMSSFSELCQASC